MRILLATGNCDLSRTIPHALRTAHVIDTVTDTDDALSALAVTPYDLIVVAGMPVLKDLRDADEQRPILLLTTESSAADRAACLNTGADYVLASPFDAEELLAACLALNRRTQSRGAPCIAIGPVSFTPVTGRVEKNGKSVDLSSREMQVLEILIGRPGIIFSKNDIEEKMYDWNNGAKVNSNTIEVYVSGLRRKLGCHFIKTVRGSGYVIPA